MTLRLWYCRRESRRILLNKTHSKSFLEAGCGSGELLFSLSRRFKSGEFVGIDINEESVNIAGKYCYSRNIKNVSLEMSGIDDFKSDLSFDAISCISVLQYVSNPDKSFIHLLKMLGENGKLLIYLPVDDKRVLPGYNYLRKSWFRPVVYDSYKEVNYKLTEPEIKRIIHENDAQIDKLSYTYDWAGKIGYELISFGQLFILRVNWILAFLFAIVYFPIILLPAWLFMLMDMILPKKRGNGILLTISRLTTTA
ncbi:MAG: class I SAM-dependent methyltransferase [Bacteroidetes bacterium]|nr:class I SAM-dependent methyltransferase [Bacteroidota bacterium]MBT4401954.1 class I SAM-dependent methyltransferase [Bacteroidota bacterium]MBT4410612.1 class I SAM-dependent methyltransferase [Bacteroidota bacterium]MBT7092249.1 class I SAM-dependent methyltransferase [Bacteroidota bacterium]MBT7466531.1 class I SAM-dependent methyltransferase [Bacteroidota bacterium]